MGLDMYLTRKTYVKNWNEDAPQWNVTVTRDGKPTLIDPKRISSVEEDIGYWRKANAIHKWFVANVQDGKDDCGTYYVSDKKLQELLDICNQVLENPELAGNLLPTTSGFFFGSTDYDQYYIEDLQNTIHILQLALEDRENATGSIYYHSSW